MVGKETETKLEVSEDVFNRLLARSRIAKQVDQLNVYYDKQGALASKAATCRIRYTQSKPPIVTLKVPTSSNVARRIAVEVEEQLTGHRFPARSMHVASDLSPTFRPFLKELGVERLERLGSMRTCRFVVESPLGGHFEMDRVTLPDGSQVFEIEIESPDEEFHQRTLTFLAELIPDIRFSMRSKYERFVEALGRRRARRERSTSRGPAPDGSA